MQNGQVSSSPMLDRSPFPAGTSATSPGPPPSTGSANGARNGRVTELLVTVRESFCAAAAATTRSRIRIRPGSGRFVTVATPTVAATESPYSANVERCPACDALSSTMDRRIPPDRDDEPCDRHGSPTEERVSDAV